MTNFIPKLLTLFLFAAVIVSCKEEIKPIPPQANFTFKTGDGGTVTFANTSTGSDLSYTWSFGDGKGTSLEQNPTHAYEFNGNYPVKLVVTNSLGKDSLESKITITNSKDLVVKADVNLYGVSGGGIEFRNASKNADTYFWDFGDGNTSKEISPKHDYVYNDSYTVKLIATNSKFNISNTRIFTLDYTTGKSTRVYKLNSNSSVFVLGNKNDFGGYAYALDATNGAIKWRHYLGKTNSAVATPTFIDNGIFVVNDGLAVRALDITNGSQLWEYLGPWASLSTPLLTKDKLYATFWDNNYTYIGLNYSNTSSQLRFMAKTKEKLNSSSPTAGKDDRIFFCDEEAYLNCYKESTLLWRTYLGTATIKGGPVYNGGKIYIGGDYNFYCVNEESGDILWKNNKILFTDGSSPTINEGVVYASSVEKLYAFDAQTGTIIWTFDLPTGSADKNPLIHSSPIVSGDIVYLGSIDNKLYAINKKTGQKIWDFTTNGIIHASPVVAENQVYITNSKGKVYALNAATGSLTWETEIVSSGTNNNFSPSVLTKSGQYFHSGVNGLQN